MFRAKLEPTFLNLQFLKWCGVLCRIPVSLILDAGSLSVCQRGLATHSVSAPPCPLGRGGARCLCANEAKTMGPRLSRPRIAAWAYSGSCLTRPDRCLQTEVGERILIHAGDTAGQV